MYIRNASGGHALPVGADPFQWGPFHASGGRVMQEGAVPSQWGPHHANIIMNNMKNLCLLRKQIVNLYNNMVDLFYLAVDK